MSKQRIQVLLNIVLLGFLIGSLNLFITCQTESSRPPEPSDESLISLGGSSSNQIDSPPASLELDSFYKKYLDASGIPIIGSDKVPDEAFFAVQKMVNKMVSMRSDVLEKMIENKIRVGIIAGTEATTDIPEYRDWNEPDKSDGTDWNKRGRGYGAVIGLPLCTCAEENVLCYGQGKDGWFNEDIFIHEFAHSIHSLGLLFVDKDLDAELQQTLDNARATGLWENTYAATNISEYFAEGVQDWFNVNAEAIPANGVHNEINTREELKQYDPALYNIIKRYFKDDNKKISCHP